MHEDEIVSNRRL